MTRIQIHDLDDEIVAALKHRAAIHGRSLEQELCEILTQAVRPDRREMIAEALVLQQRSRQFSRQIDSVELLREDRER